MVSSGKILRLANELIDWWLARSEKQKECRGGFQFEKCVETSSYSRKERKQQQQHIRSKRNTFNLLILLQLFSLAYSQNKGILCQAKLGGEEERIILHPTRAFAKINLTTPVIQRLKLERRIIETRVTFEEHQNNTCNKHLISNTYLE